MSADKHQSVTRGDAEDATLVNLDSPTYTPSPTPNNGTPSHRQQPAQGRSHRDETGHNDNDDRKQTEEEKIIALQHTKGLNWTHVKLMLVAGSGFMCDVSTLYASSSV